MSESAAAFNKMDAMYRYQRHLYDVTRKFYLIGRDRMLDKMAIRAGQTVAEIGCGTGRNLRILATRYPNTHFFGLDASSEMLRSAQVNVDKDSLTNVSLEVALADDFDYRTTFREAEPFDIVFFSYSISMIPLWSEAIMRALANLKPGGILYIVDFYDQGELPLWFRKLLNGWLRQFHVQFWSDLIPFLTKLNQNGVGKVRIESVARRYAFIASVTVPSQSLNRSLKLS